MRDYKAWEQDIYGNEIDNINDRLWEFVRSNRSTSQNAADLAFDFTSGEILGVAWCLHLSSETHYYIFNGVCVWSDA